MLARNPYEGGFIDLRLAGARAHYLSPPKDANMRIPDQLIKCVGFVAHDREPVQYGGTAFIVGVRGEDGEGGFLHLVTAKHVAEAIEPGPYLIGMNGKDGRKILLKSGDTNPQQWWYHPTERDSVDVAVTPFATAIMDEYDVEWIPEDSFATEQRIAQHSIGLGDEIIIVGLFTRFIGSSRLVPLVRTGNVAMMPDRIPVRGFGNMEAYLVEARSIGGLSGSPVFVRSTVNTPVASPALGKTLMSGLGPGHLLGLMHGHWEVPLNFSSTEQAEAVNMGVAIVVPAKKILEVLYHPELVQMRKELEQKELKKKYPVADSALKKGTRFTRDDFEAALKKVSRKVGKKA